MKLPRILLYAFLLLIYWNCSTEKKKSEATVLAPRLFDLNVPSQKEAFDQWVRANVVSSNNDTTAKKYESASKFYFTGDSSIAALCIFEDQAFEVYSQCLGEWGGALLFVDKKNKKNAHYLPSTCPKMIDFQNGKYVITSTLAHLSGSANIITLSDPRQLPMFQPGKSFSEQTPAPNHLITSIFDTTGITLNVYYPYKNRHFIVFSEYDTAYVGEVKSGKMIDKKPLFPHGIWSYGHRMNRIKHGIYISDIQHRSSMSDSRETTTESVQGAIYLKQDTLLVGYKHAVEVKKKNE